MLKDLVLWSQKLKDGFDLAHNFYFEHKSKLPKNVKKVAFFGMGGSGIAGRILKTLLDKKSNILSFVIDSPEVPNFIDTETLAVVITYSGNTWETVDALNALQEKFIPTIVLSHGGKAAQIAESKNLPFILLPEAIQPRAALGQFLGILLALFDLMGIVPSKEMFEIFKKQADLYVPKLQEEAYFADFLDIIGDYEMFHVWGVSGDSAAFAYRAQTQFNENSKLQAVSSVFPECCHNLMVGFMHFKQKPLVMMFYSDFLPTNLNVAIDATSELLKEKGVLLYKPPILGDTWEGQLFHMILWSDFASYFLGIKHGVDVTLVNIINELKAKQKEKGIK
jgi:glucose/mannose-6-phosphate isomerase